MSQSKVKNELANMIESFDFKDSDFSASVKIPHNFSLFPAHFPERPIFPGFCQIQLVLVAYNKIYNKNYKLNAIKRAKFYNIIQPEDNLIIETTFSSAGENILQLKTYLKKKNTEFTKISFLKITATSEKEQ